MSVSLPGIQRPELQALPTIKERLTFLYVERCVINRQDSAVTIMDSRGTAYVPAASLGVLLLGPGTTVSHRAMELLGDVGSSVIWVGEQGVRYYAHGRSLTQSSRLVMRQAELVSNTRTRLAVARQMYQMRFPHEDVSDLTMQQLRGREGARVRSVYRRCSQEYGVPWKRRDYNAEDYSDASPINQALSAAHVCLYGAAHSVIVAIGCSPALGFVHTGHERSFVFDVADLYKAEVTIPIAFGVAADGVEDVGGETRRRVRDAFAKSHLFERMVHDIFELLGFGSSPGSAPEAVTLALWDEKGLDVSFGVNYASDSAESVAEPTRVGSGVIVGQ